MLVSDLLEVLWTDSVVLATDEEILVDVETPYIKESLLPYKDMKVKRIIPQCYSLEIVVELIKVMEVKDHVEEK